MKKFTTEQILEDAEMTACFFRALLDKNVPMGAATTLAQHYLYTVVLGRNLREDKPKEPWEGDPPA